MIFFDEFRQLVYSAVKSFFVCANFVDFYILKALIHHNRKIIKAYQMIINFSLKDANTEVILQILHSKIQIICKTYKIAPLSILIFL